MRRSASSSGSSGVPIGSASRARRRVIRTAAAALSVFAAVVAWTLATGPGAYAAVGSACLLPRTGAHHSEGLDHWEPGYAHPTGHRKALMVFLRFPDATPDLTPQEVAADHFPATTRFFERASYGRFSLGVHPVARWLTMPHPSTYYAISRDWKAADRTEYLRDAIAAADPVVDFHGYDVVYLVADPDAPGVDSDATKVVNLATPVGVDGTLLRRLVTVFERHPPDRNVLAHETGHVFDLPDLYYRPPAGSDADWDTHVGDWDLMGSQFGLAPEPFAWHKWKLGWLTPDQVGCVTAAGTTYQDLSPDETRGGLKLMVVRTGVDSALAIEARSAVGNDRTACRQGVLLYQVRSDIQSGDGPVEVLDGHPRTSACPATSVYPPLADAPLGVGESLTAPDGSTRVTVTAHGTDGTWSVKIDEGAPGGDGPGRRG